MDRSVLSTILEELNLSEDSVANIYNYGSWTYGTNSATSDRDLMIVTRTPQEPLVFSDGLEYFHDFELHKLWNQYDVCVHSIENFEKLLEKNYLLAVECVFLPSEFKIKEEIDFQKIYLEKYFNAERIKIVAFYENYASAKMADPDDDTYPKRSSRSGREDQSETDYLFKNLFHGFRYLDFAEQLIQTKSIPNFKRVSHVLQEMKKVRQQASDQTDLEPVRNFIRDKSDEWKAKLIEILPTKVKGTFEAHVTIDCTHNTEKSIEQLQKACENTKYKVIFIDLNTKNKEKKLQQLMTSSYHCGEYPSVVQQIQNEVHAHFKDFNITRVKIESLASNQGVPELTLEKKVFWDDETNYFEFHYKILVDKKLLKELQTTCERYHSYRLHLSHNAFQKVDETAFYYLITMRIFDLGRIEAFNHNEIASSYLTQNGFKPLKVVREFIVYDSHIGLDNGWK